MHTVGQVEREAAGRFPGEHAAQDATVPGLHGVGFVPADDGRAWGEDVVHNRLLRAAKFRGEIRPDGEANIVCLVAGGAVLTENLLPSRWIALGDERIGVLPEFSCVGGAQLCERLFRPLGQAVIGLKQGGSLDGSQHCGRQLTILQRTDDGREIVLSRERRLEDGPAHGRGGAGVGGKQAGRDGRIVFAGQTIHRGQAMLDRFLEIGHLFQGCGQAGLAILLRLEFHQPNQVGGDTSQLGVSLG